jgi:hypothetical protein
MCTAYQFGGIHTAQGAAIPAADYGQYVPGVDIENVSAGTWLNLYDSTMRDMLNGVESY